MAETRSYAVRDAGPPSRLGKIYRTYPYDLRSLLEALDDARLRSFSEGPQVVTVVTGRRSQVIRRYERGKETWTLSEAEVVHEQRHDEDAGGLSLSPQRSPDPGRAANTRRTRSQGPCTTRSCAQSRVPRAKAEPPAHEHSARPPPVPMLAVARVLPPVRHRRIVVHR
jgi:hypothetical protein